MMARRSAQVLRYGHDTPLPEQRMLHAGPLSLLFEHGDLRYISLGGREVIRRIYVAVRDQNWGTVAARLSNVRIDAASDSFRIGYDAAHQAGQIDFRWRATIDGAADGTIRLTMRGVAGSTFLRNRIGFCVLHPATCAGAACIVEHSDGSRVTGRFPRLIAPHQPFKDIRAIEHEIDPGVRLAVRFDGDVFEMEDQRNWTDASFKTYCTPLALPFPVQIQAGTEIAQSVTLTLSGAPPRAPAQPAADPVVRFGCAGQAVGQAVPQIGLGVAHHGRPLTAVQVARLRALQLQHLRVDLHLADRHYPAALRQAGREASALGVPLEIAVFLSASADDELGTLRAVLDAVEPPVCRWLIFHAAEKVTSERWLRLARIYLEPYAPAALVGGTNCYFTELNRQHPPIEAMDGVCYSINPQVHACDNASLVETLAAQAATVYSARHFCGDLPLIVSPITLRPRFNPDATGPALLPAPGELPPEVDVRQMALFAAGWTLGSFKYLAESGVASVTYYETTGWRGVLETELGAPLPDRFQSLPDTAFPLYHVLADIGELAAGRVLPTRSDAPLRVDGLALRQDDQTRVLLANMTAIAQQVQVDGLGAQVQLRFLDDIHAAAAMVAPEVFRAQIPPAQSIAQGQLTLTLPPYAVVRIDSC